MKQSRKGSFVSQETDKEKILAKIRLELGDGGWDITYNISGARIVWVAEKVTVQQGPL